MSIYDPLSEALGIEPNPELFEKISKEISEELKIPNRYNSIISKQEAIQRNSEIITCDKCGVKGNMPNMMRWHFDNCKTVLKKCECCNNIIPRQNIKDYVYKQKKYCNKHCYYKSRIGIAPIIMTEEIKEKLRGPRKK